VDTFVLESIFTLVDVFKSQGDCTESADLPAFHRGR
jgi:hypothetical protein